MGHRRCRSARVHAAPIWIGHHAQWPHPPDRAEGGRQHHLPLRALHRLSAAAGRGRSWPGAAEGARRSAAPHARGHQRLGRQTPAGVRASRQYIGLRGSRYVKPAALKSLRALAIATALWTGAAMVASGAGSDSAARVVIKDFMFAPVALTVKAGSVVSWTNQDNEP